MTRLPARTLLTALFLASSLPLLLVASFPAQLHFVMESGSYLVFHNVAEFFSIMVSVSVFGVGWYAYDRSQDRHALFLGAAFLATGLIDFMHVLGNAAMPAFVTANSTNKSTQYWIAARLLGSAALLVSAFVYPDRPLRWLTKRSVLTAALAVTGLVFAAVTFFPAHVPVTFVQGVGLTRFKVLSEWLVIALLLLAFGAYWKRMQRTADTSLVYYAAAFIVTIFGEAAFASYRTGFDAFNVLGHVYKVVGYYLIYRGAFAASVSRPYLQLSRTNEQLRREIAERHRAEREIRGLNSELEQRVAERTARLEHSNRELDEKREWLRVTLSSIGEAVLACDTAGRVTFMNPVAAALTGWTAAEALGQPIRSIFATLDEPSGAPAEDIVGRVLREGRAAALVSPTALVSRDGRQVPIEDSAAPIKDRAGAVSGVVLVFREVTEKRRAEEALRKREEDARARAAEVEAILDCIADGVMVYDTQGRIVRSTPAADEILKVPASERGLPVLERGARLYEVTDEEGRRVQPEEFVGYRAAVRGEPVKNAVQKVRSGDHPPRWLSMSATPMFVSGKHTGAVISLTDITVRKQAEEALREASRRKDEFLGMLSHELRNPLAPIRNSIHVLKHASPLSEQAARARSVIERQTEHLTRLVDDLLDVTRIARGKIELRRSRVDLREVVVAAADDFRLLMQERGLALTTVLPESQVWCDADVTRITQVVGNLLHNATKFTSAGGEVTLSLHAAERGAEIRVRDTGAGLAPALLPLVFDAFVQGEPTLARTDGGLGLGLALVKGITELHGGSVHAESGGVGAGAEFVVRLPLAAAARTDEGRPAGVRRASRVRRVLVVDDNADAARSLADVVKMLGHQADVAYDGPSAIEKARATHPNVVLCDIGLPGMSGYEVAQALRGMAAEGMQLIALSGYAQPEDVRKAVRAGFHRHVAKPADVEQIGRLLE